MSNVKYFPPQQLTPVRDAFSEYNGSYTNLGSDYSITDLIKPPRVHQLFKRHKAEINEMTWDWYTLPKAFKGSAIHDRLEYYLYRFMGKNPDAGYLIERRLWDRILDRKISGKFDIYRNEVLYDWKTCSVWKRIYEKYEDFEVQLNLYAYLLGLCGVKINALMIVAWYMDWDKTKVYDRGYPKSEIEGIQLTDLWSEQEQREYLEHRITLHKSNENVPDDELTPCTAVDRWDKPSVWKIMHPDSKKSLRNLPTEQEAIDWIAAYKNRKTQKFSTDQMTPTFVPGYRQRCTEFCKANVFCSQWQEHLKLEGAK